MLDFEHARQHMVDAHLVRRGVKDRRVLDAMRRVPREKFVDEGFEEFAYEDSPLPIAEGQTISQPFIVAYMLEAAEIEPTDRVLEVGTGSGYVTACLARLGASVLSLERHPALAQAATGRLAADGIDNTEVMAADALTGFAPQDRFDAIAVTGAMAAVPDAWLDWLAPGGRMFVVRGLAPAMEAVLLTRIDGHVRTDSLFETTLDYLHGAAPVPRFTL